MSIGYNPSIVTDGLMLYNDAANTQRPRVGTTSLTLNSGMSDATNNYYTFDGTDDSISISTSVYNTTYTGKTIMVAAYMDSSYGSGVFRGMIGTSSGTSQRNFNLYAYGSPGSFQYHYSTGDGVGNAGSFNGSNLTTPANQWFVGAISQTSTTVTYYHNAINVGSAAHALSQYNSGTNEFLGRADNFWYGRIGFWMVYSKALTAAEISQNFNAVRGRYGI